MAHDDDRHIAQHLHGKASLDIKDAASLPGLSIVPVSSCAVIIFPSSGEDEHSLLKERLVGYTLIPLEVNRPTKPAAADPFVLPESSLQLLHLHMLCDVSRGPFYL